jgi:2-polyprenyl-6-methoxyphenol hydroxylase-like FAD-dependent oxidoreductase
MEQAIRPVEQISAQCCIAGGGPAGVMMGVLLARAGINAIVLEKHKDFLRDFRGDTVHPSTLEVMYELGVLEGFLACPHQEYSKLSGQLGASVVEIADFSHLPTRCKFIALMPQWDFLNFLTEQGRRFSGFHVKMQYEVTDLLQENGRVVGMKGKTPDGSFEVRAPVTIGADGRHSIVREKAGFQAQDLHAPIDVLWMRLPRKGTDGEIALGHFTTGRGLITVNRGEYWQCAWIIPKGGLNKLRERGLPAFRGEIVAAAPFLRDRVGELRDWDNTSLLSVALDRLREWSRPGLLCIGDSAHAMSPVGGVGINLAIQDAVAAANILAEPLRRGAVTPEHLHAVQQRRELPTRLTQGLQALAHNKFVIPVLKGQVSLQKLPLAIRLLRDFPALRRFPARLIGMGFRPEHVKTSAAAT